MNKQQFTIFDELRTKDTTNDQKINGKSRAVLEYAETIREISAKLINEGKAYVSGVNCSEESFDTEFVQSMCNYQFQNKRKEGHGKDNKYAGVLHMLQTFFEHDEDTYNDPGFVNSIGREFVEKAFPGFQSVIFTHYDTTSNELHNHILVCAYAMDRSFRLKPNRSFKRNINEKHLFSTLRCDAIVVLDFGMEYIDEHYASPTAEVTPFIIYDDSSVTFDLEQIGIPGGGHLEFDMIDNEDFVTFRLRKCDNPWLMEMLDPIELKRAVEEPRYSWASPLY